jgi:hypothetical protein
MSPELRSHSCCGGEPTENLKMEKILGVSAHAEGNEMVYCRLIGETDTLDDWKWLPVKAEQHGMAPLFLRHLLTIDALIPHEILRELRALAVRHRMANQVRTKALCEILDACESKEIRVLVLKGAALAHLVYPEPGLRPMRDIDLLVSKQDGARAQALLMSLGFEIDPVESLPLPPRHHHLPIASRTDKGLRVSVEIHTDLFPQTRYYRSKTFEDLEPRSTEFKLGDQNAFTLGIEDMLWHVYRHAVGPPLLASPLRYIHVADLISIVENYAESIDWRMLQNHYPQIVNILPALNLLSPFSESTLRKLPFVQGEMLPSVGEDYSGWPRRMVQFNFTKSSAEALRRTFNPPEWWLRLYYGGGGKPAWFWHRYIRHPLHIFEWVFHLTKTRITGLRSPRLA